MKKKAVILLTVLSIIFVPIVTVPSIPISSGITLYTHGDG